MPGHTRSQAGTSRIGRAPLPVERRIRLPPLIPCMRGGYPQVAWAYGPVTSYSLSLREIDTVQNPGEFVPSVIETIVRKGHLDALGDPLVQVRGRGTTLACSLREVRNENALAPAANRAAAAA